MSFSSNSTNQDHARSYKNLETARLKATTKSGYSSLQTRARIQECFLERFGKDPYTWQLDVAEAVILGLDCLVLAGTGSGKTIPFMMPLLLDPKSKVIVISPLKVLQEDQTSRFKDVKISAVAVNGETWSSKLKKNLEDNKYQGVFASPEMCFKHPEFRRLLTDSNFNGISAVIIDEAHCIAEWGGDFRTAYKELAKLRAFFPPHIPILATTATATPDTVREIRSTLGIDSHSSFFLNLGNDRPNISFHVHNINSATHYDSLRPHIFRKHEPTSKKDLIKGIVFVNAIMPAHLITRTIRSWLPAHLRKRVDYMHSLRSPQSKRRVMKDFRRGRTRILIATESAGMGMDISDIEQVIQFGVPSSLSVWIQRGGRGGRSKNINARAILLVEKSMFERKRKRRKGKEVSMEQEQEDGEEDEEAASEPEDDMAEMGEFEWKKAVDDDLRKWIATEECRRAFLNKYFDNPIDLLQAPTHTCCDNCEKMHVDQHLSESEDQRPSTPVTEESACGLSSAQSTPSKSKNDNGKRGISTPTHAPAAPRRTRTGDHLDEARTILFSWRVRTLREQYTPSPFTLAAFMPDCVIKTLSSNRRIQSVSDMKAAVSWAFTDQHGQEILDKLRQLDCVVQQQHEAKKKAKKDATAARQRKKKEEAEAERDVKKKEKENNRKLKAAEADKVRAQKAEAREAAKRQRPPPKRPRRAPLQGVSVINLPTTSATEPSSSSSPTLNSSSPGMFVNYQLSAMPNENSTPWLRPCPTRINPASRAAAPAPLPHLQFSLHPRRIYLSDLVSLEESASQLDDPEAPVESSVSDGLSLGTNLAHTSLTDRLKDRR